MIRKGLREYNCNDLMVVFDGNGKEVNTVVNWIPIEKLVKAQNIKIELPNSEENNIDTGWYVDQEYLTELFRYGTIEITDKCTVRCSGFCARSSKKHSSSGKLNYMTLKFANKLAELVVANEEIIKKRYGITIGSESGYGNLNRLTFNDFVKTHVNRRLPQSTFCISGGEPTEHKYFKDILSNILQIVRMSDVKVVFATNLTNCLRDGFLDFFRELSQLYNDKVELQLSYNEALVKEYIKIVEGDEGYKYLQKRIPDAAFRDDPKYALIKTVEYVLHECNKKGINAVLRITKHEDRNDLVEANAIGYFINNRNIKEITCYGEKTEKTRFSSKKGIDIRYYVAPVVNVGFAKNGKSEDCVLKKTFADEVYINTEGRVYPHMAWNSDEFGWIGIGEYPAN